MRQRDDETIIANAARHSDGPSPRPSGAQRGLNDEADRFEDVIAEIHAEMRGVRVELGRLPTLDNAILAERGVPMKAQMSAFREWPSSDAYFAAIATQLQKRFRSSTGSHRLLD